MKPSVSMVFRALLTRGFTSLLVALLPLDSLLAQICAGDTTRLTTQAKVDAFSCSEVTGSLVIDGPDITNLDSLSSLTSVGGNLQIDNCSVLTSLAGLSSLTALGGSLQISNNGVLLNVDGLLSLTSVNGLTIFGNVVLANLDGMSSLASLGTGWLWLSGNDALANVDGLSALTSV